MGFSYRLENYEKRLKHYTFYLQDTIEIKRYVHSMN
jgi:hypothetical protein